MDIMLIDDEPVFRKGLAKIIQQTTPEFRQIHQADCALEALNIMEHQKEISVALVDINLPDMNGLVLVKKLKTLYPDITIVMISGYDDFNYARQAIQLQVFDYLLKPIAPSDIQFLLEKMIKHTQVKQLSNADNEGKLSPLCESAIEIIKQRYSDTNLSLAKVAEDLFVDSSYLSKQLKKQTGQTFNEYLTTFRLNKAKELLKQATLNLTIQEISLKVGYSNPHYFSRLFKLHEKVTPTEFKEQYFKN